MTDEARAADSPPRPVVPIPGARYLYVIFDGPERNFVHIEEEGKCLHAVAMSVWKERGDGLWSLGPFLQPPAEVAEQPAADLGAMVAAIQEQTTHVDWATVLFGHLRYRLELIHDTADRLAVALEREQALMDALARVANGLLDVVAESEGVVGWHLNGAVAPWDEFEFIAGVDEAFKKYEGRQPRKASSTEGEQ